MRAISDSGPLDLVETQYSAEDIDEGTALIKEFLTTWAAQNPDVDSDGDEPMALRDNAAVEKQVSDLRRYFEEFEPRLQANAWCQSLLASL